MKFNHKAFDWKRLLGSLRFILTDRRGGWNMPPSPPKQPFREIKIGGTTYRISSFFRTDGGNVMDRISRLIEKEAEKPGDRQ